jgi:hypothetical protein
VAVAGVNAVAARRWVRTVDEAAVVAAIEPSTVRLKVALEVAPLVSVTVSVVAAVTAVGVPLTHP